MARRYRKGKKGRKSIGKIVAARTGSTTMGNIASVAMSGYRLAKKVARLVNVEYKKFEVGSDGTSIDYNGTVVDLCDPAQGSTAITRQGDSIKPLHLTIRGHVNSKSAGNPIQTIRVIVFRYKEENSGTLTASEVLDSTLVGTVRSVYSPKSWDNRFHSKILWDKTFSIGNGGAPTTVDYSVPGIKHFTISKKLFGHINWAATTTTQEGGGLYMLVISDSASNGPYITYHSRVTYTDN